MSKDKYDKENVQLTLLNSKNSKLSKWMKILNFQ